MSLKGKVAIVTGGSRGIGAGIAKELASRGAKVLITYNSNPSKASAVVDGIKSNGGIAGSVKADCVDKAAPNIVVDAALELDGGNSGIDIVINNAGCGEEMYLADTTYDYFEKVVNTNMRFPMFLVQAAMPYLRRGGRIVNIGSVCAREGILPPNIHLVMSVGRVLLPNLVYAANPNPNTGWAKTGVYSATKAALEALTRVWAVELSHKYGVTVNNINPGPVATDMWEG